MVIDFTLFPILEHYHSSPVKQNMHARAIISDAIIA
jgi:hypothetical protein